MSYNADMIELALPAGSLETAISAFNADADAVYFGMKEFSARKGAANFSIEDLSKIKRYASEHSKKIYVTVNTLVDDSESAAANRILAALDFYEPDGVIIQDLGLIRIIREYYPVMRKYTDYLASKSAGYILEYGLGDWCDYGPAPAGFSQNTPAGITATSHFFIVAECTAKAAAMVGDRSGKKKYSELGRNIAKAFNDRFFDTATCVYGNGSQCSYAMPLFLGIVPGKYKDRVLANFLESVRKTDGRLTTGDIGNRYLFQTLSRNGFDEVMYDMHNHTGLPGYGYQIKAGVTTLAEQWNPELGLSWNHFMMGQIEEWFYRALGGINPDPDNPGFAHFFIRPSAPGNLQWVRCSYESVKGLIESDWKKEDGKFILSVTVPENTEATVILPYSKRKMKARPGKHVFEEPLTF